MNRHKLIGPLVLTVAFSAMAAPDGSPDSEQVAKLLFEAKSQAVQLREDASIMESYTRFTSGGWEAHVATVNTMREHVNATTRLVNRMESARATASPWQEVALDRIKPLLKEIASNTESVINYINTNPKRMSMPKYKEYIETNADVADKLAGLITDFVDYGKTKSKLEQLTTRLELPEK